MRIGIFGGTFNPVHNEHIAVALSAVKELGLDKLIVMPTFISPHKNSKPAPASDRLEMLRLAFSDYKNIEISDFEINQGGTSFTFLTVEHFHKEYPNAKLFLIVGADMLVDFKTWKNPEKITSLADVAVFKRENFSADFDFEQDYFTKRFNKPFIKLNYVGKNDSSTKIRVYSSLNLDINGLTEKKVVSYIKEKGLYSGGIYEEYIIRALKPTRVIHTANVIVCALKKAKELKLDEEKVRVSALLHDVAKYQDYKAYKEFVLEDGVPSPVIHAFLGAFIAEKVLGITDKEIIDAIKYHTSGKANMTTLSKLIFVADMVEEGRDYEGVDYLRSLYEKDLDLCFKECLREELIHLQNKKQYIYIETLNAYDYYVKKNGD